MQVKLKQRVSREIGKMWSSRLATDLTPATISAEIGFTTTGLLAFKVPSLDPLLSYMIAFYIALAVGVPQVVNLRSSDIKKMFSVYFALVSIEY